MSDKRAAVAFLIASLPALLVACDAGPTSEGATPTEARAPDPPPAAVRAVPEDEADLHLWVSNQSFADDPVTIAVRIDGVEVADQPFDVGSQHNWILFPIEASPGKHVLSVVSDTGAEMRKSFRLPEQGRRYAVIDYWYYPGDEDGDRYFSWDIRSTVIAFM